MEQYPEEKVAEALASLDLKGRTVLAACSGGSDSVFLLVTLSLLSARFSYSLSALTVNHRLRSDAESSGDADFVENLCKALDPPVACVRKDLVEGEVAREAESRGMGIEEAARHLRYRFFEQSARDLGAVRVMTGHNRNDRLETMLMRFLEGSGGASLSGIARERGVFFRPLLDIDHATMQRWLSAHGFSWREDSTNDDDRYFRNRVRHHLVPLLDAQFPGWDTGVLSAAKRAGFDERLCRSLIAIEWSREASCVRCDAEGFLSMQCAVRLRFLRDGLVALGSRRRVSAGYLERIAEEREPRRIAGAGLVFRREGNFFLWEPDIVQNTKSGYLVYIRSCGKYTVPFGTISVSAADNAVYIDGCPGRFTLPLTIRTRAPGDTVKASDGKRKTLKKLMNEWAVRDADRDFLPLVEENGQIRAVWGSALGYPDWLVQI